MAAIEKRQNKDGTATYRVKVRLKGYPTQSATFERLAPMQPLADEVVAPYMVDPAGLQPHARTVIQV